MTKCEKLYERIAKNSERYRKAFRKGHVIRAGIIGFVQVWLEKKLVEAMLDELASK